MVSDGDRGGSGGGGGGFHVSYYEMSVFSVPSYFCFVSFFMGFCPKFSCSGP